MVILRDFLTAAECGADRPIEADRRPSTIADPNGDHYFRTSETCDLPMAAPDVLALDERFSALCASTGRSVNRSRASAIPGQEFKAHTDYFDEHGADFDRYCAVPGSAPGPSWSISTRWKPVAPRGSRFSTS
jgi:prolyl 4-hydroxylase